MPRLDDALDSPARHAMMVFMSSLQDIEAQALRLSALDREALADALLQSLDHAALDQVDPAWIEEAERRYQDWRSDRTQGIAGQRFFEEIRRELGWS